jgi:hypothetical protein
MPMMTGSSSPGIQVSETVKTIHVVVLIAAATVVSAGCQTAGRKPPYSDNPLLASRQPLVHTSGQREKAAATANATNNPVLSPPVPLAPVPTAIVQTPGNQPPPPTWGTADAGPTLPEAPPAPIPQLQPLPARSMTDGSNYGTIPASATMPSTASRIMNGKFGYATDHSWLQGELDRHYRGYLDLRYRPASEEDTFGGKVRLDDDPRLAEFRAGDIVAVEGELIRDADPSIGQYPRFRIKSVRLIERKN